MIDIIIEAIILILCAVGGTEIIRMIILYILDVKDKGEYCYIVLPVKGRCEDIESKIRAAAARVRWCDSGGAKSVICLDLGMDEETRKICEKTACDYEIVTILTKEEFESNPVFLNET